MAIYDSGLSNSFVAVFSGRVLIGINFANLSFDLSNSTLFFFLFHYVNLCTGLKMCNTRH